MTDLTRTKQCTKIKGNLSEILETMKNKLKRRDRFAKITRGERGRKTIVCVHLSKKWEIVSAVSGKRIATRGITKVELLS